MQDFCFPGPGGVAWTHRVRTFGLAEAISDLEMRQGPPDLAAIKARRRAHEIGAALLAQAATHNKHTEGFRTEHQWRVSVVMPDENRNYFAEQIEEEKLAARNAAFQMAADDLRAAAVRYDREVGACAGVIAAALRQQALWIESRRGFDAADLRGADHRRSAASIAAPCLDAPPATR